jgi:uncharacterized membrane protein YkoI
MKKTVLLAIGLTSAAGLAQPTSPDSLTNPTGYATSTSTPSYLDTDSATGSSTAEKPDVFRGPIQDSSTRSAADTNSAATRELNTTQDSGKDVSKSTMQGASTGKVMGSLPTTEKDEMAMAPLAKIKLTDAIKVAQPKATGKIISAKLDNENGYLVYNIRSFKDGQVTQTFVDAGNGKLISSSLDSNTTATGSSKTQ